MWSWCVWLDIVKLCIGRRDSREMFASIQWKVDELEMEMSEEMRGVRRWFYTYLLLSAF